MDINRSCPSYHYAERASPLRSLRLTHMAFASLFLISCGVTASLSQNRSLSTLQECDQCSA